MSFLYHYIFANSFEISKLTSNFKNHFFIPF
nr:MAG TPA: hypothetical protein [Caudoviricetes sp.]